MSFVVLCLFSIHINISGWFFFSVFFYAHKFTILGQFFFSLNFLFNVEQNVFLSCNFDGYALRTRYVSRNSKSSEFINQIGVFVFFLCVHSAVFCRIFFSFQLFIFFDSVTCLQDQLLWATRCEKWCCRDTTWWVERSKYMLYSECMACACTVHFTCEYVSCFDVFFDFAFFLVLIFYCYSLHLNHQKMKISLNFVEI